jgi:hypothetical protein
MGGAWDQDAIQTAAVYVIVGAAVVVAVVAILRAFFLWYFKINRIVALLEVIASVHTETPTSEIGLPPKHSSTETDSQPKVELKSVRSVWRYVRGKPPKQ